MRRCTLADLTRGGRHVLEGLVPGRFLAPGGLSFKAPGERSHDAGFRCPACDGRCRHVHGDAEVFVILQGHARIEVDGVSHDLAPGDVVVCEPGEDHHLVADPADPCVNLWLNASDHPHP